MQTSLSIVLLTQDRFTYVELQKQGISVFCNSYYEPSNIVVWFFWCWVWFLSTQRSSFPWPFWILILSLDRLAIPVPRKRCHLPLYRVHQSFTASPDLGSELGSASWWFPLSGQGTVRTALLIRKEFLGWRFVACDCQAVLGVTLLKPWCSVSPLSSHNVPHSHTNINEHAQNILCNSINEGPVGW